MLKAQLYQHLCGEGAQRHHGTSGGQGGPDINKAADKVSLSPSNTIRVSSTMYY